VDNKIIEVAESLTKQAALVEKILYKPILDSWNPSTKTLDITRAIEAEIDVIAWSHILTHICHRFLHTSKPSIHAVRDFVTRLPLNPKKVHLKKDLSLGVIIYGSKYILQIL
jgi:hypothetical protein